MRAGELRQRITIQDRTIARNSFGEEVETWVDLATVWGKVESLSGSEFVATAEAGATVTHQITIRRRSGMLPTMHVLYRDRTFEITAVLEDLAEQQVRLLCFEQISTPERT